MILMRRVAYIVLAVILLAAVFSGCTPAPVQTPAADTPEKPAEKPVEKPQDTIVLRLAETHAADYPTTKGDMEFARLVEERTNGRVKIEVYPGSQLGEEKAVIEQVQFGAIDFTRVSIAPLTEFADELNVLQLPYIYRSSDHMWNVLNGDIGEEMLKSIEEADFVGLCYYDPGARNFYNNKKEVKTVEDLKGMKIRVMESKMMMDLITCLGGSPTPMPFGEVYSALQTGVIDGAENNFPSYDSTSHYEVAKYYTLDGHTRVPEILIGSKMVWDKLSKEDQEIIKQAAKDSVALQRRLWAEKEKESEEKVRAAGCVITELTPEAFQGFQDAVAPLYEEYSQYSDIIQRINDTP
ncbi:MAG: TRAP transporter substrate-binding protein [Bacillota bacterium]|jgi:tripartite ATP-independent transporter DctP family solute receptor|nr:TRAP transporter substrate-binding protein [Bacillota bacterium]NLV63596.1 TRAP transporter substrate-binding protein [Clostridiaceae bacterium]